ncbi:hypothetical protein NP233_g4035 [Leucocoprinus birnbaumii]|uniref:Uncharacterized protein n=1 Tax=Leucocoprinus birnbaumii TaxID=56174 RepID=A0AAD5VVG0_9AGAR|nr:hypothetical protein NP233_g4035 [Leucocoprinus birnbaumii]
MSDILWIDYHPRYPYSFTLLRVFANYHRHLRCQISKHAVETTEMFDFLKEIVEAVPDPSAGGTIDLEAEANTEGKKKRKTKKATAAGAADGEGAAAPKRRRKKKADADEEDDGGAAAMLAASINQEGRFRRERRKKKIRMRICMTEKMRRRRNAVTKLDEMQNSFEYRIFVTYLKTPPPVLPNPSATVLTVPMAGGSGPSWVPSDKVFINAVIVLGNKPTAVAVANNWFKCAPIGGV